MYFNAELAGRSGIGGTMVTVRFVARAAAAPRRAPPSIEVSFADEPPAGETAEDELARCTAAAEALVEQLSLQLRR